MQLSLQKIGGLSLIIASILAIIGNAAHPRSSHETSPVPELTAGLMLDKSLVWFAAHAGLMVMVILMTVGLLIIYYLLRNKNRLLAITAASLIIAWAILSLLVFTLDGFVGPLFADNPQSDAFKYNYYLSLVMTAISLVAYFPAIAITGLMYKNSGEGFSWFGWIGVGLGVIGTIGYLLGIFGTYWVYSPIFPALIAVVTLWTLALGILVWRKNSK